MAKSRYNNYSKEQLLDKIKQLEKHRYGLVWEDKQEDVAERCEQELPVLHEDISKEIKSKDGLPQNILIEGDNYHVLYALNFTHKRKVDVIYIDPPYNTGNKDFIFNDKYVDQEDAYRHSKWLSFIEKRLKLARTLLKDTGAIFISIDNNEISQLKILMNKVFGERNFIGVLVWRKKEGGGQTDDYFVTEHEYILAYAKSSKFKWVDEIIPVNEDEFNKKDSQGKFTVVKLAKWGSGARKEDRPTMYFPIKSPDGKNIYPKAPDGSEGRWRVGKTTMNRLIENDLIYWEQKNNEWIGYEKVYYEKEAVKKIKERSILYELATTGDATKMLTGIFGKKDVFENPKPIELIEFVIRYTTNKHSVILDFMAGSGTTGHAVLELNKEDGGSRQFILCTNNEVGEKKEIEFKNKYNIDAKEFARWKKEERKEWEKWCDLYGICSSVTYLRIKKVIKGYNDNKPIQANLKYFKTGFVPQVITDNDKRVLVNRSTELLCLAENTFELVKQSKIKLEFAIYRNQKQLTAIIYDEDAIEKCKEELEALKPKTKTVIYVFSYDHEYNVEDFEDLTIRFNVKPIPEAILNVYRKNAKLRRK